MDDETPLLLTIERSAKRLGCGRTTFYELVRTGAIETVTIGRLRRVPMAALDEYVERLREAQALEGVELSRDERSTQANVVLAAAKRREPATTPAVQSGRRRRAA